MPLAPILCACLLQRERTGWDKPRGPAPARARPRPGRPSRRGVNRIRAERGPGVDTGRAVSAPRRRPRPVRTGCPRRAGASAQQSTGLPAVCLFRSLARRHALSCPTDPGCPWTRRGFHGATGQGQRRGFPFALTAAGGVPRRCGRDEYACAQGGLARGGSWLRPSPAGVARAGPCMRPCRFAGGPRQASVVRGLGTGPRGVARLDRDQEGADPAGGKERGSAFGPASSSRASGRAVLDPRPVAPRSRMASCRHNGLMTKIIKRQNVFLRSTRTAAQRQGLPRRPAAAALRPTQRVARAATPRCRADAHGVQ